MLYAFPVMSGRMASEGVDLLKEYAARESSRPPQMRV